MQGDFFTETAQKFAQENSSLLDNTPAVSALNPDKVCSISGVLLHNQQYLTHICARSTMLSFSREVMGRYSMVPWPQTSSLSRMPQVRYTHDRSIAFTGANTTFHVAVVATCSAHHSR